MTGMTMLFDNVIVSFPFGKFPGCIICFHWIIEFCPGKSPPGWVSGPWLRGRVWLQHARAARAFVDVTLRNILSTRKEIYTLIVTKKLCCSLNRSTALFLSLHRWCISNIARSKSEELAPGHLQLAWEMIPKVMVWAPRCSGAAACCCTDLYRLQFLAVDCRYFVWDFFSGWWHAAWQNSDHEVNLTIVDSWIL